MYDVVPLSQLLVDTSFREVGAPLDRPDESFYTGESPTVQEFTLIGDGREAWCGPRRQASFMALLRTRHAHFCGMRNRV